MYNESSSCPECIKHRSLNSRMEAKGGPSLHPASILLFGRFLHLTIFPEQEFIGEHITKYITDQPKMDYFLYVYGHEYIDLQFSRMHVWTSRRLKCTYVYTVHSIIYTYVHMNGNWRLFCIFSLGVKQSIQKFLGRVLSLRRLFGPRYT